MCKPIDRIYALRTQRQGVTPLELRGAPDRDSQAQSRTPFLFQRAERLAVGGLVSAAIVQFPEIRQAVALDQETDERAGDDVCALFVEHTAQGTRGSHAVEL